MKYVGLDAWARRSPRKTLVVGSFPTISAHSCTSEVASTSNPADGPCSTHSLMTAWDFSMDAVWADIDHAWVWRDGGSYCGVPPSNFFGWFLTVYIFYQLFALYLRNRVIMRSPTGHWRLAILFYAASAAGNLLVVAPLSMGGHFVDAAGKQWAISGILWASRLVSILLMMPLSLMAWVKASGLVKPFSKQVPLDIPSK